MNNTFYTCIIPLAAPLTVYLPIHAGPRPRVITTPPTAPVPTTEETGEAITFVALDVAFWVAPLTRSIHAQIAHIPTPILIYGPDDFIHVATDMPEQHAERLLQVLGADPAAVLQALCDRTELPQLPTRVPREIAAWRAKAVMQMAGLLPQVEALIESMPGEPGIVVRAAWNNNSPIQRNGQTVVSLSYHLGLNDEQLDAMFIQAAALTV